MAEDKEVAGKEKKKVEAKPLPIEIEPLTKMETRIDSYLKFKGYCLVRGITNIDEITKLFGVHIKSKI